MTKQSQGGVVIQTIVLCAANVTSEESSLHSPWVLDTLVT